jgi:hypothetical protein
MKNAIYGGIALFMLFFSSVAECQTAEETVLFILYGYEKRQDNNRFPFNPKTLKISRIDDCNYKILMDRQDLDIDTKQEEHVDFSGVSEIVVRDFSHLDLSKECRGRSAVGIKIVDLIVHLRVLSPEEFRKETTQNGELTFVLCSVSQNRVERAVTYFRSNYCRGRAF